MFRFIIGIGMKIVNKDVSIYHEYENRNKNEEYKNEINYECKKVR